MNAATFARLGLFAAVGLIAACGGGGGGGETSNQPEATFTVDLPGVSGGADDSITVPKGRPVYAILVSGYGRNRDFSEVYYYKLAKHLAARNAYVHFSWWNNLLSPNMGRALHAAAGAPDPDPGSLPNGFADIGQVSYFLPGNSNYGNKAEPSEDHQFQADAKAFLRAIRSNSPTAKIILVGHSMGGGAVARLGADPEIADIQIDLLAPIDPVGNRSWPAAPLPGPLELFGNSDRDFNWTRWRATREEFLGYKAVDCSERNFLGLCTLDSVCIPVGSFHNTHPRVGGWTADLTPFNTCNGPYVHQAGPRRFGANVVYLYHRYQKESVFPFDYARDEHFGHPAPLVASNDVADGTNFQKPVTTCLEGGLFGNNFNPIVSSLECASVDGHGEIVGYHYRDTGRPIVDRLEPYPFSTLMRGDWPTDRTSDQPDVRASRRAAREDLVRRLADPAVVATHQPEYPQLDLVVDGMIRIVDLRFGLATQ